MKKPSKTNDKSASERISQQIAGLTDWRGKVMARLRKVILAAASGISEEWKWDSPVYVANGNVVSISAFKDHVKINFFKGASLPDPNHLFNAGLDAKSTRAIDFGQADSLNEAALTKLIRAAVALNKSGKAK